MLSSTLSSPPVITFLSAKGEAMGIATRWDAGSLDVLFGKPNVKYVALFDLWNYSISVLAHPEN
jgi:hypothetical protein